MAKKTMKIFTLETLITETGKSKTVVMNGIKKGYFGPIIVTGAKQWKMNSDAVKFFLDKGYVKVVGVSKEDTKEIVDDLDKTKIRIVKYTEEECAQIAKDAVEKDALENPDQYSSIEAKREGEKKRYEKFYSQAMSEYEYIDYKGPPPPLGKRKYLELPMDVITRVMKKYTRAESKYFIERYIGYTDKGYMVSDPTQGFLISSICDDMVRAERLRDIIRIQGDLSDPPIAKELSDVTKRILELQGALGDIMKKGQMSDPRQKTDDKGKEEEGSVDKTLAENRHEIK
jgi:hypothetical protein